MQEISMDRYHCNSSMQVRVSTILACLDEGYYQVLFVERREGDSLMVKHLMITKLRGAVGLVVTKTVTLLFKRKN